MVFIKKYKILFCLFAALIIIFDSKTAYTGAAYGLNLCIKTVIPSLFPLFFLSGILQNNLDGIKLKWLSKVLGVPKGAELLWVIGILGGYPLGAKSIYDSYQTGGLEKNDAERMLGFCNNAGPAFIFGVGVLLFRNIWIAGILWLIQIASSVLTAVILPGKSGNKEYTAPQHCKLSVTNILKNAIMAITTVCSWVILFRVLISVLEKWLIRWLPVNLKVLLIGIIELTNGFDYLFLLENNGLKFVIANVLLTTGGLCVGMQTIGVIGDICWKTYLYGKIIQSAISLPAGLIVAGILFSQENNYITTGVLSAFLLILTLLLVKNRKKDWIKEISSCTI